MKVTKIVLFVFVAVFLIGCRGFFKGKEASEKAIANFHELYNENKLDEIYTEADPRFRTAASKQKYDDFMNAIERKLGKVVSTTNAGWNIKSFNLETTIAMNQTTVFQNGQGTEFFRFVMNGTNAVLLGYNIESTDLIEK